MVKNSLLINYYSAINILKIDELPHVTSLLYYFMMRLTNYFS